MRLKPSSGGFSLIELILALSIGTLLLALLFSLYFTLSRTVDDQAGRRDGAAVAYAVDRLMRDLMNAQPAPGYEEGGFALATEEGPRGPRARITFCTARRTADPAGQSRELSWFELIEVEWGLDYAPQQPGRLWRAERPLIGPDALQPAVTNVLAFGVDLFSIELNTGDEWTDTFHATPGNDPWPRAARIRVVPADNVKGAEAIETEILIPTGWEFEPEEKEMTKSE